MLNAVAWRLLASAGGEPIPLPRAFLITLVTFAVNYSTPLASFGGEPLKVVAATKFLGTAPCGRLGGGLPAAARTGPRAGLAPGADSGGHPASAHPADPGRASWSTGTILTVALVFLFSRHREGLAMHALDLLRRAARCSRRSPPASSPAPQPSTRSTSTLPRCTPGIPAGSMRRSAFEMLGRFLALAEYWVILYGMGMQGRIR